MDQRLRPSDEYSTSDWLKLSLLAQVCMVQLYGLGQELLSSGDPEPEWVKSES